MHALLIPLLLSAAPSFDREVAPILVARCIDCHGGVAPKGRLDLSRKSAAMKHLRPGKPDDSALYRLVRDNEMPPKHPLSASEKDTIKRWIAAGATWGTDPIDPFALSSSSRAGLDWWSLREITRPAVPDVRDPSRARNVIDRFVLARLDKANLRMSPEASRETLLRRVAFGLTGLPPTPEARAAFLADDSPDAYERLIDRSLASPHHGERWGRHWLDLARFGESDGFERDLPRPNAWPYRDWVIRAFNDDLRFDAFAKQQLAGDLMPDAPDGLAASGFLVAGAHDIVVPASDAMKKTMLQDELEDVIGVVSQTFLALTVHCARCHDHKFDPVPQADYYRMASTLVGVRHGERSYPRNEAKFAELRRREKELREQIAAIEKPARDAVSASLGDKRPPAVAPLAEWDFTRGTAGVTLHGRAKRTADGLVLDGVTAYATTSPLDVSLKAKTLEAWVKLDGLAQRGGGVVGVQTADGHAFDAIVYGERQPNRWMAGSDGFVRTRPFDGTDEKDGAARFVHVVTTYAADGTITAYRDGVVYGRPYRTTSATFDAGKAHAVFGLRHGTTAGPGRMLAGTISRARLYDRALTADEVAASFAGRPVISRADIVAKMTPAERERHAMAVAALKAVEGELAKARPAAAGRVYAANAVEPGVTHLLLRGNVTTPGEAVAPETIRAVERHVGPTKLAADAPEAARRLALAERVASAKNPLFARVIVNRLWHWHFGVGLVDTPNDFGFNGGKPSHPELLDYLASELIASGWSLKHLHRLILTSATYRQSSAMVADAAKIDADNRLLWRKSPMRLEAEAVRDAMLAASGSLDATMGGKSYQDFKSFFFKGTQFYEPLEQVGDDFARRSVYRMWARGGRSPLLDTFDCPDPSTTTPRRAVTVTPLQALSLYNNAFVFDRAAKLAELVSREEATEDGRARRAFVRALGRNPSAKETAMLADYAKKHGTAAMCRVLFNTGAFVQVD